MAFKRISLPFNLIIIDLEINNPNTPLEEIFQLGWVVLRKDLSIELGENILFTITNPITPYIEALTGTSQGDIDRHGVSTATGIDYFNNKVSLVKNSFLSGWGNDVPFLKQQLDKQGLSINARSSSLDLKLCYQLLGSVVGYKYGGGLKSSLQKAKLSFDTTHGQQHSAMSDAFNTARLFQKLLRDYNEKMSKLRDILLTINNE